MIDDQELVHRLLDAGVADKQTLRKGIALRNESGKSLYEALILNRLVSQRATVRLIGKLLSVPTVKLEAINPSDRVTGLVPASMARRNRAIPLGLQEKNGKRLLLVAMFDPTDVLAVGEVSTHTGYDVRPVLIGPRDLAEALQHFYGVRDALSDDIFGDISGIDFASSTIDKADGEWQDVFDKRDEVGAESSDISLEMRDRPSTDVLDIPEEEVDALLAEDEDPLDAFEIVETGRHKAIQMADLDRYEVDDAITGNTGIDSDTGNHGDTGNHSDSGSFAQILSANAAEQLFTGGSGERKPQAKQSGSRVDHDSDEYPAAETSDYDEDTDKKSGTSVGMPLDELGALHSGSEVSEASDGTSIGHGVRASLVDHDDTNAIESEKERSDRTSFGMRPNGDSLPNAGAAFQAGSDAAKRRSRTDYRALGAQILKEEESDEVARKDPDLDDAATGIHNSAAGRQSAPQQQLPPDAHPIEPPFHLPDDVPTRELLEVVVESMIQLGLTDAQAIIQRARDLAAKRRG